MERLRITMSRKHRDEAPVKRGRSIDLFLSRHDDFGIARGGFTAVKWLVGQKVSFQAYFVGNAKVEVPKCKFLSGARLTWVLVEST